MTGGEIAGIIAASAFLVIALAVAVPLVKLGKVMDESAAAVRQVTTEVVPVIAEARQTIRTVNGLAASVERIVASITKISDTLAGAASKVSDLATSPKAASLLTAFNWVKQRIG